MIITFNRFQFIVANQCDLRDYACKNYMIWHSVSVEIRHSPIRVEVYRNPANCTEVQADPPTCRLVHRRKSLLHVEVRWLHFTSLYRILYGTHDTINIHVSTACKELTTASRGSFRLLRNTRSATSTCGKWNWNPQVRATSVCRCTNDAGTSEYSRIKDRKSKTESSVKNREPRRPNRL